MSQETTPSSDLIIISVGGSLIVPDHIDTTFLQDFKNLIIEEMDRGKRFILITGGGKTCRKYQQAAREVTTLTNDDLDWLGIHATRLNAHLVRTIFYETAHPEIFTHPDAVPGDKQLVIAAGFRPGGSTDLRAVQIAQHVGATCVINLSDINYVYDKDPDDYPDAKPLEKLTWSDFRKLLPEEWDPGLSAPFDPIAAREAEKDNLEVIILNGTKLDEVQKCLQGEEFVGTTVR